MTEAGVVSVDSKTLPAVRAYAREDLCFQGFWAQNPRHLPMKVLYINHTIQKSGAAISLGTLIRHLLPSVQPYFLLRQGSEVDEIVGAQGQPSIHARFIAQVMTTMYAPGLPFPQFLWQLLKAPFCAYRAAWLARRWAVDLVHVNETTLLFDAWGCAHAGFPVIIHARTACALRPFEKMLMEKVGCLGQVAFVAIDDEVRGSLPESCRGKCEVVYNPIDLGPPARPEEVNALREAWGCNSETLVVGQAASLHAEKGVWDILKLAEATRQTLPKAKFVLVGDDRPNTGLGPELKKSVAQRNLESRVFFAGYQTNLAAVYGAFDVALCLFGGALGGVGRAAYEAALAGKPLIATLPDPLNSPTLKDGEMGLLFKQDDLEGMSEALVRLGRDPSYRTRLGESAKKSLGGRHDPKASAAAIFEIYQKLLKKNGGDASVNP